MRKFYLLLAIGVLLAAGAWFFLGRNSNDRIKILSTAELSTGTVQKVLQATGIIKPQVGASVNTGTRATGLIKRMYVRVGDQVERGELIAEIDDRELKAQKQETLASLNRARADLAQVQTVYPLRIEEAEADLAAAEAEATYAGLTLARNEELVRRDLEARDVLDNARQRAEVARKTVTARRATLDRLQREFSTELTKAEQEIARLQAQLQAIEVRISYTRIFSPIAGVVTQVAAQEGETVVAGLEVANLITILVPEKLEMWIYVDETDVGQVEPGMAVTFQVDSYPDRTFAGNIEQIYPGPEIRDNIVYYQAVVPLDPDTARRLRPEMTTQCQVIVDAREDVLALPNEALKWVDGTQVVFVQRADGRIDRVSPELGLQGLQFSEVLSGLAPGDTVATRLVLPENDSFASS